MLYIFAGFPKTGLNAGGLQHAVEKLAELVLPVLEYGKSIQYAAVGKQMGIALPEHDNGIRYAAVGKQIGIALLEHDKSIQYRKEGVFIATERGEERLRDVEYRMSDLCLRDGITWDWFGENWGFGNGVTVHKTTANYEMKTVVHGTEDSLDEYLLGAGPTRLSDIALEQKHIITEGWEKYEKRWLPGFCPQENHIVHLTWLVMKHRLSSFAYDAIRQLIEVPGQVVNEAEYEPKHFSEARKWDGKSAFGGTASA